ncbi:28S ribosomal protein S24, mitochondrial [Contarinia nasturtii]|uniref:28S ribosomal protein S24, mitochondrial n=1 Tax=Contarinia nasturtii TaxID=265458 RepID=UPI0012D38B1E|nr:28S ribosomal protein S24, mitochondrial [Contarinia nasturtii]
MYRSILGHAQKLMAFATSQNQLLPKRMIHVSAVCNKTQSGKYKKTPKSDRPLTYEMANPPWFIATRKSWNSWNCSNLEDGLRPKQTAVEDMFIRKFIVGTFPTLVCSEVIIKRQFNHIRISFLFRRAITPSKYYFLIGFSEELLSYWLQCPVTLEIQSVERHQDIIFKYV